MEYTAKIFTIPELSGISTRSVEEHIKLYQGYVKHANLILTQIKELSQDVEKNTYLINELQRRFGFEFDGMRNHEYYFASLEGGYTTLNLESSFAQKIIEQWGSADSFLDRFKSIAMTRGVGWAMLYYDRETHRLACAWVEEQHLGHLTGLQPILALDMWEHSYMLDYAPSEKKKYVDAFFANINWNVIENNFSNTLRS